MMADLLRSTTKTGMKGQMAALDRIAVLTVATVARHLHNFGRDMDMSEIFPFYTYCSP